jgi:hypothetical protein
MHDAVAGIAATLLVTRSVERKQHIGAELAAFLEDLVDQFPVDLGVPRQFGELRLHVQQFVKQELEISERWRVLRHCLLLGPSMTRRPG